jgi:hypothetical protein
MVLCLITFAALEVCHAEMVAVNGMLSMGFDDFFQDGYILLPVKTSGVATEYTVADPEGGQPCGDGKGMPRPKL